MAREGGFRPPPFLHRSSLFIIYLWLIIQKENLGALLWRLLHRGSKMTASTPASPLFKAIKCICFISWLLFSITLLLKISGFSSACSLISCTAHNQYFLIDWLIYPELHLSWLDAAFALSTEDFHVITYKLCSKQSIHYTALIKVRVIKRSSHETARVMS